MICLIQRVTEASVQVDGLNIGSIGKGLLVLVGFEAKDADLLAQPAAQLRDQMAKRLLAYRVFPDPQDRMNLNVMQAEGGVLLVPQFTLAADTSKGLRPGFHTAAQPEVAENLFSDFVLAVKQQLPAVQQGQFGADMKVSLVNDGPVTFWLQL